MSKKKKIYEDENGKKYIIKNGKKEYVAVIDSCVDFFDDLDGFFFYILKIVFCSRIHLSSEPLQMIQMNAKGFLFL